MRCSDWRQDLGEIFWWFSRMDSRLLWILVATFIVVLADLSDGEAGAEEHRETQGGHGEGSMATVRIIRTTEYQRKRWRPYRLGSLSALSRGLMKTASPPQEKREEGAPHQVREAGANGPPFLVHSGTPMPHPKVAKESLESSLLRS